MESFQFAGLYPRYGQCWARLKPKISSGSLTWVARAQTFGPYAAAFPN